MPARAQASSLSDTSPEMPTAPITAPAGSRTSTPPGTGATRPSAPPARAGKKGGGADEPPAGPRDRAPLRHARQCGEEGVLLGIVGQPLGQRPRAHAHAEGA